MNQDLSDTQRTMLAYEQGEIRKNFRNRFMQEFTRANVITLFIWLAISLSEGLFHLTLWIQMFAVIFAVLFSGLIADVIWYLRLSQYSRNPYGLKAYLSRIPLYLVFTLVLVIPVSLAVQWPRESPLPQLAAVLAQFIYQLFNQWHRFNYVRKMSLDQL